MKTIIIVLLLLSVMACAARTTFIYWKDDLQMEQFRKDRYDCTYQAQSLDAVYALTDGAIVRTFRFRHNLNSCMAAKGYYIKEVPKQ